MNDRIISIIRQFRFCAGHRLFQHKGKCQFPHGHNYEAEIEITSENQILNDMGMVIDFTLICETVGKWIDEHWDHAFLFNYNDIEISKALSFVGGRKLYGFNDNPTAESMAKTLYEESKKILPSTVYVVRVKIRETDGCWAEVK